MTAADRPRLLVSDPDAGIRRLLSRHFSASNYTVVSGQTACEVLSLMSRVPSDLVILSIDVADLDAAAFIARVRRLTDAPIIALRRSEQRLTPAEILDCGASDCLEVPFSLAELDARCRRQLRSIQAWPATRVLITDRGAVEVDPMHFKVSVDGVPVAVTQREFALLAVIAGAAGRKLTRAEVMFKVWGPGYNGDTRKLRRKVAALRDRVGDLADALRALISD